MHNWPEMVRLYGLIISTLIASPRSMLLSASGSSFSGARVRLCISRIMSSEFVAMACIGIYASVYGITAIGGFMVVGKMLAESGSCVIVEKFNIKRQENKQSVE